MGRRLLLAQCCAKLTNLCVGNVHLESLNNEDLRERQLKVSRNELRASDCALLCGDFNFDATKTWGDWKRPSPLRAPHKMEIVQIHRDRHVLFNEDTYFDKDL